MKMPHAVATTMYGQENIQYLVANLNLAVSMPKMPVKVQITPEKSANRGPIDPTSMS